MNGKIVDYAVVCRQTWEGVQSTVRSLVIGGWEPAGGITYSPNGSVLQAIVLRESPPAAPAVKEKKKA